MQAVIREVAQGFAFKATSGGITYTEPLRVKYNNDLERAAVEQLLDAIAHAANAGVPAEVIRHVCDVGASLQEYSNVELVPGGRMLGAVLHSSSVVSYMGVAADDSLLVVRPGYDTTVVDPAVFYSHYADANGL